MTAFIPPQRWNLSRQESDCICAIYDAKDVIHRDDLLTKITRHCEPRARSRLVDVVLWKLRHKLSPFNVEIESVWGRGVRLSPETKEQLRAGAVTLPAQNAEAAA